MEHDPNRLGPGSPLTIGLPDWLWEPQPLAPTDDEQMAVVLELAERNIENDGGPFAAGVFDDAGNLVGPGVNRVVASATPVAHAEIVAIAVAGQRVGTWDLASVGRFRLVTTTEPCAMCLGAVPWAGVHRLVCGATDDDARAVGFDEGIKPDNWQDRYREAGITVVEGVRRDEAAGVLRRYAEAGGAIYNGAS